MKKFLLSLAAVAMTATLASAETVDVVFANLGYANAEDITTVASGDSNLTIVCDKAKGQNAPKYYTTGSGMRMYKDNTMTVSVSAGYKITQIDFTASGSTYVIAATTDNGTYSTTSGSTASSWTGDTQSVVFTTSNTSRTQKMVVTYVSEASADKKLAELSFAKSEYNVDETQKIFSTAYLSNPNGLAVTYASSDTSVATVAADGTVSIVAGGTTTITATSEETDEFMAGKASYTLNVLPAVYSVEQMLALADNAKVLINTNLYVGFVNINNVFVTDGDNWIQIYNSNDYKTGDIIPYGWSATYLKYNGVTPELMNATLPAAKGTAPITYPTLSTVSADDVNKVAHVVATFAEATPATKSNFTGTNGDETYTFYNNYTKESVVAGTYKVLAVVSVSKTGSVSLYPISFEEYVENQDPELPSKIEVTVNSDAAVVNSSEYEGMYDLSITGQAEKNSDSIEVLFVTPEGWDGVLLYPMDMEITIISTEASKVAPEWAAAAGFPGRKAKGFTAVADNYTYEAVGYLYKGDQYAENSMIAISVKVKKGDTTGVDEIEAAEADAEYYTLDGVKVAQPAAGIYVKVCGEKVEKVVIK